MNEEEKKAIEYLKTRLYGNEGCKYIDVAQEDLRIFINLVDRKEKDIEGWKKYCEEIEEERIEMSNKNCELEFEVEKLQKENEILKEEKEQAWEEWNNLEQASYETEQKLKQQIKELQKEYNKLDKQVDEYIKSVEKDVSTYYENKERISIMQTLSYFIDILKELIEERSDRNENM